MRGNDEKISKEENLRHLMSLMGFICAKFVRIAKKKLSSIIS